MYKCDELIDMSGSAVPRNLPSLSDPPCFKLQASGVTQSSLFSSVMVDPPVELSNGPASFVAPSFSNISTACNQRNMMFRIPLLQAFIDYAKSQPVAAPRELESMDH